MIERSKVNCGNDTMHCARTTTDAALNCCKQLARAHTRPYYVYIYKCASRLRWLRYAFVHFHMRERSKLADECLLIAPNVWHEWFLGLSTNRTGRRRVLRNVLKRQSLLAYFNHKICKCFSQNTSFACTIIVYMKICIYLLVLHNLQYF